MRIRALAFFCLLASFPAVGAERAADAPLPYININSAQAARNMEKMAARDPGGLSDAERGEWVRSRFAWIALLRLEGKEAEAAEVFVGCAQYCEAEGASAEWGALKRWGCRNKPDSQPCRAGLR